MPHQSRPFSERGRAAPLGKSGPAALQQDLRLGLILRLGHGCTDASHARPVAWPNGFQGQARAAGAAR